MLNKIFSRRDCKYCECMVNDFIDKRLSEKKEKEFIAHIENCFIIKHCDYCKKLIQYFLKLKNYCTELREETIMPANLNNRILNIMNNKD